MIRQATDLDFPYIQRLIKQDFQANVFENNPFMHILIYEINKEIIGFLCYSDLYDHFDLDYIWVKETMRHQGIAGELLSTLLEYAKQQTIPQITLEVSLENQIACRLYQKYGFQKKAIRKNYYGTVDGILMVLEVGEIMKKMYVLAIESSCDETSVSIICNGSEEIATVVLSQMDTHANFGGVVPEVASRMHIENITMVLEECLKKANMTMSEIDAIAITYGPGLIGSLLIGLEAAKTLAYLYQKPLIPVHHIAGHIYANNLVKPLSFPLIALVVSGGHTEIIYMKENYSFERIGGTLDDAVGEAYDKVARVLGLHYPGGPLVDQLAHEGEDSYPLPLPLDDDSYNFSFSGIKSAVINLSHNEKQRGNEINVANLACSFQNRVVEILTKKTMRVLKEKNVKHLIIAGGVAANKGLRERFTKLCDEEGIQLTIPVMKYCTDNAAMIGAAGYFAYQLGRRASLDLNSKANDGLK